MSKKKVSLQDLIEFTYWLNHEENKLVNIKGLKSIGYVVTEGEYLDIYIKYLELKGISEYNEEDIDYESPLEIEIRGINFIIRTKNGAV